MSRLADTILAPLDRHLPGYADALAKLTFAETEREGNPAIASFRDHHGPGLLVPEAYGGAGLPATEAVGVQTALGFLSPSTAVALAMHQFTLATLVEIVRVGAGMEWMVIEAVARQDLLVASGFAEGRADGKVLHPTMRLRRQGAGYRLDGDKVPCSLSRSMDLITISAVVPGDDGDHFAVALVPAASDGLTVSPMWRSPVLAGAETARVTFTDVPVPEAALSYVGDSDELDATQVRGYVWFEILIVASYIGAAASLAERVCATGRARGARATDLASELALCCAGLDSCAARLDRGDEDPALLAHALLVRYAVERALQRVTDAAFEVAGVAQVAGAADPALVLAASRALAFHPPSRARAELPLARYLDGDELVLESSDSDEPEEAR